MTTPPSRPVITTWLDPGKTTGIASWDGRYDAFTSLEGDLEGTGWHLELLSHINDLEKVELRLGWERYLITPASTRKGTGYWSLETIGMARWLCLKHEITVLEPQLPSQMALATDDRLKAISWHKPGKPHANDAARHLLRHLLVTKALPEELKNKVFKDAAGARDLAAG